MGCYGILCGQVMIYVGKGDIRARLLAHLNGDNASILSMAPNSYLTAVTSDMDGMEKRLIQEYDPKCNKRVG